MKRKFNIDYILISILPILSLLIVLYYKFITERAANSFEFSLFSNYYLPLVLTGIVLLLYFKVLYVIDEYKDISYFRNIILFYLALFVFGMIILFIPSGLAYINTYNYLDLFILFNFCFYIFCFYKIKIK